jgi:hypothetical protein
MREQRGSKLAFACLRRPVIVGARPLRPKALGPDEDGTAKARGRSESIHRVRGADAAEPSLCWSDSEGLVAIAGLTAAIVSRSQFQRFLEVGVASSDSLIARRAFLNAVSLASSSSRLVSEG